MLKTIFREETKKRNCNIELLRIIAMLMIILGHLLGHTGIAENATGFNFFALRTLQVLIYPATNVYVLISSYFLIDAKFKLKRIVFIWLQVFFFSLFGYLVCYIGGWAEFSLSHIIKILLPISGNQYWFANVYMGLYLFSPFLSIGLKQLTKKQYEILLILLIGAFSIWPSLPFAKTWNPEGGNGLLWFFVLYAIAGYIKLHYKGMQSKNYGLFLLGAMTLTVLAYFIAWYLSKAIGWEGRGTWIVTVYTSPTIVCVAVLMFLFFLSLKDESKYRRLILFFSNSTFSVYLIHENLYIKVWLRTWLNMNQYITNSLLAIICLGFTCCIFLVCVFIDKMTWQLVKRAVERIKLKKVQNWLDKRFGSENE